MRLWPSTRRADDGRPQSTPAPPKRVPLRRRPMPCPHCDAELDRELAASPTPVCPHCALPLLPMQVAGVGRRALGGFIDVVILAVTAGPIAYGLHRLIHPLPLAPGARGLDLALTLLASDLDRLLLRAGPLLVLVGLYFLFTVAWAGRTLGHRLLSLRIVDQHGRAPSLATASLRTVAQLVGIVAAALGPLWVAFDSERRALHDLVAGTYVVSSPHNQRAVRPGQGVAVP